MNCIIANSNECSREGIRAYLQDDAWQVYAAASADVLQRTLQQCCEGIMLYYIPFCSGDAAMLRNIIKKYPRIQVIAYTESSDAYNLRQCIHEKVAAWMSSHATLAATAAAMRAVEQGHPYCCDTIQSIISKFGIMPRCKPVFSKKELEVLHYIGQNHTNDEIAQLLYTSPHTIYGIRKRMMKKTRTGNIAALLWYAIEHGYITIKKPSFTGGSL